MSGDHLGARVHGAAQVVRVGRQQGVLDRPGLGLPPDPAGPRRPRYIPLPSFVTVIETGALVPLPLSVVPPPTCMLHVFPSYP